MSASCSSMVSYRKFRKVRCKGWYEMKRIMVMVGNATFNNISFISWRSDLLLDDTGEPRETTKLSQVTNNLSSHNVGSSTPRHERGSQSLR